MAAYYTTNPVRKSIGLLKTIKYVLRPTYIPKHKGLV